MEKIQAEKELTLALMYLTRFSEKNRQRCCLKSII